MDTETGHLWDSLSETEKQELLIALDESLLEENLILHALVKATHQKWLQ
jgi:TRAP-type C4-dicarboxylate transport system substrate-binding protein